MLILFIALCVSFSFSATLQADKGQKININTASKEELMELQQVGPKKAESIIEYRENQGLFEKTEDIMNVSGIGKSTYELNKDLISVSTPTSD